MTKTLLSVINSDPSLAAKAFKNLYREKTYAIGRPNGHIDTFRKTKRGAEGYIKREQQGSYYDEYLQEMVSYGDGMFYEEIKEQDILNPAESLVLWFRYLRSIQGQSYLYDQALKIMESLSVNEEVENYVITAIDDMRNNRGLIIIEEEPKDSATEQTEQKETVPEVQQPTQEPENQTEAVTITYQLNEEKNGVELYFSVKPSEEIRNVLKAHGFRWSRNKKCWYAKQSEETTSLAKQLAGENDTQATEQPEKSITATIEYPEIEIDDNDQYIIDQALIDREHSANWIFRSEKPDRNKEIREYFTQLTNEIKSIIETTENEYLIYKLKQTLQYYKKHYFKNYVARLKNRADSPSIAVTGRAGRNARKDQKMNNRYDNLMREFIQLEKDYKKRIESIKTKIKRDKEQQLKNKINNTSINISFETQTKEFTYMGLKEKKRVYSYQNYWICKLWACYRIFKDGKEIYSMKTTDKLEDAKKYVSMLVQSEKTADKEKVS
ncbi:hypothetical protein [Bacillus smithii]|uniref:hypothetical protein n=1 Tax=Bacillus smithii TaxID=1479 RepID=UPI002E249224|nr:hypothetical protein [Bacillus smithii]MED4928983.1 hypothetical protein [Bacillus smithii]